MKKQHFTEALVGMALVVAGTLAAPQALAVDPAHWQAGPVSLTPTLDVKTGYVDNLLRSSDDEDDTWALITKPRLQAWLQNGLNTYSLAYTLTDYRYADSSDDDYTDNQLNLDIHHEFNAKNVLNVAGEYYDGHEQRGTGLAEGDIATLIDKPVELERYRLGGDYTYGNRDSKGRLQFGAKTENWDYQNFRDYTQYRNRDQDTLSGTFFWKVAPRTDVLAEVRYIDNQYDKTSPDDPFGTLDSEEMNYLVGVAWDASAKTSGSVRVGISDREYDSDSRSDTDNFMWEADVTWAPRSYSIVNFLTRRRNDETNGVGDAIDVEEYQVRWDHAWDSRSSMKLDLFAAQDDYTGSPRSDDRYRFEAGYVYSLRRWFDLGATYRYEKRDSDRDDLDYDANAYYLEAKLSL
jgi:polysaccharide biosynthesis protein VpsM